MSEPAERPDGRLIFDGGESLASDVAKAHVLHSDADEEAFSREHWRREAARKERGRE